MNNWDSEYLELLEELTYRGYDHYDDSRKMNTKALFGYQTRLKLQDGFPAMTTKKLAWKAVVGELIWFLRGDTNIKYLIDNKIHIWDKDAYGFYCKKSKEIGQTPMPWHLWMDVIENPQFGDKSVISGYNFGDLGPIYGAQWMRWGTGEMIPLEYDYGEDWGRVLYGEKVINQISNIVEGIKSNPRDRGHIITAWNVSELKNMALRPCHPLSQFNVRDNYLDFQFYMRSNDVFLGLPFNMASYALLTHIIAYLTDKIPGDIIYTVGNVHLYENHIEAAKEQLERDPNKFELPKLEISDSARALMDTYKLGEISLNDVFSLFKISDFTLTEYNSFPGLKADMIAKIS